MHKDLLTGEFNVSPVWERPRQWKEKYTRQSRGVFFKTRKMLSGNSSTYSHSVAPRRFFRSYNVLFLNTLGDFYREENRFFQGFSLKED